MFELIPNKVQILTQYEKMVKIYLPLKCFNAA
jgi:hypothetical protein